MKDQIVDKPNCMSYFDIQNAIINIINSDLYFKEYENAKNFIKDYLSYLLRRRVHKKKNFDLIFLIVDKNECILKSIRNITIISDDYDYIINNIDDFDHLFKNNNGIWLPSKNSCEDCIERVTKNIEENDRRVPTITSPPIDYIEQDDRSLGLDYIEQDETEIFYDSTDDEYDYMSTYEEISDLIVLDDDEEEDDDDDIETDISYIEEENSDDNNIEKNKDNNDDDKNELNEEKDEEMSILAIINK